MSDVVAKRGRMKAKSVARNIIRHESAILIIVMVALILIFSALSNGLTSSKVNMTNILLQSANKGVASLGQAFVILTAGIDLSVAGTGLLAAIIGSTMMTQTPDLNIVGFPVPVPAAVLVMLVVGLAVGLSNGLIISRVGMPPLIVTLAVWQIVFGIAYRASKGLSIINLPDALIPLGRGDGGGVPIPVIVFIAVAVVSYLILNHTSFGRSIYAVGGSPVSAWLSGIDVKRIKLFAYALSGLLAGLAGIILTARVQSASMRSLAGLELETIAAVCIGGVSLEGGRGNIIGVIIGVLIIGIVNNGMSVLKVGPEMQNVMLGVVILAAVAVDYIRRRR